MSPTRHSIVIPVFNEERVLRELHRRLTETLTAPLEGCGETFEIVFVNDGSFDGSEEILRALCAEDPARVRVVCFSRNFGHEAAISAGLDHATGDTVIMMDADLQDPPEVVLEMIARWREGYEVVYGTRSERKRETWLKKATAAIFYRVLRSSSELDIPLDAGDFRLLSRRAASALAALREKHRLLRGMTRWIGFKQIAVPYVREARHAGETKYSMRRMAHLAWDGITSFSLLPLRLAYFVGVVSFVLGSALGLYVLATRVIAGPPLHGTLLVVSVVLVLGGIELLALGILGEYVGRSFEEIKRRPLYVVDYTLGMEGSPDVSGRGR